jgi:hypothetical protein
MPRGLGHIYWVRSASDPVAISEVRIPADFVQRAKAICAVQRDLIDARIDRDNIPFPKKIPRQRRKVDFDARLVACAALSRAEVDAAACDSEPGEASRRGLFDWRRISRFVRLKLLSKRILDHARPGPVVIVSRKPDADMLSRFLSRRGRESIALSPGYGTGCVVSPGYLVRPAKGSLVGWVLDNADRLDEVGAIVFLGDMDFSADVAALGAAHQKPVVLLASVTGAGCNQIAAVHPSGFCRDAGASPTRSVRLSIVIVSYNQVAFLEAAIRSVIAQDYPDLELIIVDGGSTDGSIAIIEKYRQSFAHVIIEPDEGQSDALNKGFSRATGEVMNWLCSDDLLEPGALARIQEAYLATGADLIVGGCVRIGVTRAEEIVRHHTSLVVGRKVQLDAADILDFINSWERGSYFFQPEVFFSRRIWEASGRSIKKHLYYVMDYDLWLRMALAEGSAYHIPAMIACSRVHPQQKTRATAEYMHQVAQLVEEYQDLFTALEAADHAADQARATAPQCREGR